MPDLTRFLPAFVRAGGRYEWVFSLRLFIAGMVALYLAFWLGLEEPKWALMTVYIVAQPMAGMTLAKGSYRLLGTLVGASAALIITGLFISTPSVLLLALSLWMMVCTFGSSLLRNFRSYGFVLSGYSAVIIAVPAMLDPAHAFSIALARVTEIGLGIGCSMLVSMLVWPRSAGNSFLKAARQQFYTLLQTVAEVAAGKLSEAQFTQRRQQLVAASVELENLREHALFDTQQLRHQAASCRRFGHELLSLITTLGPLHAYVLRYADKYAQPQQQMVLVRLSELQERERSSELRDELLSLHQDTQQLAQQQREAIPETDPDQFYAGQLLLEQAAEICDRLRSSMVLYAMINGELRQRSWRASSSRLHVDFAQAGRNSIRVLVAMLATAGFWWWSASEQGAQSMILVAVVCSLFATRDDPVKSSRFFLQGTSLAAIIAFGYYLVLPHSEGFFALALWLSPLYLLAGLAKTHPPTAAIAGSLLVFFPELLNIGPHQVFSVAALFNGFIGLALGMSIAILAFLLLWPGDKGEKTRLKLCQESCSAVASWPIRRGHRRSRHQLETLLYDRLARTFPQLQTQEAGDARLLQGAMALVSLALGLFFLDAICRRGLPNTAREAIEGVIDKTQLALGHGAANWQQLATDIESASAVCRTCYPQAESAGERRRLVRALVRLRMQQAILSNHRDFIIAGSAPNSRDHWRGGWHVA